MSCTCITEIPKKLVDNPPDTTSLRGKVVLDADFANTTFAMTKNRLELMLVSQIALEVQDRKSKIKLDITHTYCPFCGVKHKEKDEKS